MSMLFETMLLTGLRPEEACGLKWSAINENTNELSINNAYKDSPIYNEEYMFLNQYRKPFVSENLSDNMRKFIKKYELEYMTPYGLRHSFASFCSEKGMDQLVLMKLMGHSDFNTTQKYYISTSNKRKKLAMEKAYKSILEKEKAI